MHGFQKRTGLMRTLAVAATVFGGAVFTGAPAQAQETDAAKAKPAVQYWFKICPTRKGKDGKPVKICVTQHEQFNQRTGELNVALAIREQEGRKPKLLVTVPLGVALPAGMAAQFDKIKEPQKLTFVFCHPEGCVVEAEATDKILNAMKQGANINLSVFHTLYNTSISFSVPLKGFTAALKGPSVDGNEYFKKRRQLRIAIRKRTEEAMKAAKAKQGEKKKTE